ncbi:MAG TPA: glycosyltransferase family 2 protein [Armatimonadota bacterium]|nr:glycosyltransferase family 2 protein [Armatimonadota bacterium]
MEQPDPRITVIVPAREEEATIAAVVADARRYAREVVVVDGESRDRTVEQARLALADVVCDDGLGKGAALRIGARHARGEVLVFMDADGSHDPADIPRLAAPILRGEAELVVGSRMLGGSDELHGTFDNFIRNTGSCLLAVLVNRRWHARLTDIENGFRAVRKQALLALGTRERGFLIEQEMVLKCLKAGYRVAEVASHEYERAAGCSKLPTRQGWRFVWHFTKEMLTR